MHRKRLAPARLQKPPSSFDPPISLVLPPIRR